jgi:hypothetical protein
MKTAKMIVSNRKDKMLHQPLHKKRRKSQREEAEVVDVVFLDIDGVLLPFGGDQSPQNNTCTDGCIFPNRTMDALTSLLQQMSELELPMESSAKANKCALKHYDAPKLKCNPKLVLSSTWRARPNFIEDILSSFRCYAAANPQHRDIWNKHSESFFDICDPSFHSTRHQEIYNWIKTQRGTDDDIMQHKIKASNITGKYVIQSWIALDDEEMVDVPDAYPDTDRHAVKTKSSVGLVQTDVELALMLVKNQIMEASK